MGNLEKSRQSMQRNLALAKHVWRIAFFLDGSLVSRHQKYLKFLLLRTWIFISAFFLLSMISLRQPLLSILIVTMCLVDLIAFARLRVIARKNALVLLVLSCTSTLLFFIN
jgi:hypothetical protein